MVPTRFQLASRVNPDGKRLVIIMLWLFPEPRGTPVKVSLCDRGRQTKSLLLLLLTVVDDASVVSDDTAQIEEPPEL